MKKIIFALAAAIVLGFSMVSCTEKTESKCWKVTFNDNDGAGDYVVFMYCSESWLEYVNRVEHNIVAYEDQHLSRQDCNEKNEEWKD